MTDCRYYLPLLETYADGELSPDKVVEVQQHIVDCPTCSERVRFSAALSSSIRNSVSGSVVPTASFEARVRAALAAERERDAGASEIRSKMLSWRAILPVAAAAAAVLVWAAQVNDSTASRSMGPRDDGQLHAGIDLLDEVLNYHSRPPQARITEPSLLKQLEPDVGYPVPAPEMFQRLGAHWEGARIVPLAARVNERAERAVWLRYDFAGHLVTMLVYDSARLPLREKLQERLVNDAPVYVGSRRGYTICATEHRGVGYAVTSDLDDRESCEFVATIH